jgi:hypothetical protein
MTFSKRILLATLLTVLAAVTASSQVALKGLESTTGVVGFTRGQSAVLNVLDEGAAGGVPLYAVLAIVNGDGEVLGHKEFVLSRGKAVRLEVHRDNIVEKLPRIPIRGIVRLYGRDTDVSKPYHMTLEIVDDDTGRTGALMSCPSDFAFAGNAGGRGDVFFCPPPECNLRLITP